MQKTFIQTFPLEPAGRGMVRDAEILNERVLLMSVLSERLVLAIHLSSH